MSDNTKNKLNKLKQFILRNKLHIWVPIYIVTIAIFIVSITLSGKIIDKNIPELTSIEVFNSNSYNRNDIIDDEINSTSGIDYFTKPESILKLKVNIKNPLGYEIDEIKIDDNIYKRDLFLKESNKESIYITYKVCNKPGSYVVEAQSLSYINKDNRRVGGNINDESSLILGIMYENKPEFKLSERAIMSTGYSIKGNIIDSYNLGNGGYKYFLFDNDNNLIEKGDIGNNNLSYSYNKLIMGRKYRFIISGSIDLLDGKGKRTICLYDDEFETNPPILDFNINTTESSIKLNPEMNDGVRLISSALYLRDALYKECIGEYIEFNNLYSKTLYDLELNYSYLINGIEYKEAIRIKVSTKEYQKPIVDKSFTLSGNRLDFSYRVDANSEIVINSRLEIYNDGVLVIDTRSLDGFINLDHVGKIKAIITVQYNLNDFFGLRELKVFKDII